MALQGGNMLGSQGDMNGANEGLNKSTIDEDNEVFNRSLVDQAVIE